jgi:hypothetical protein
VRRRSNLTLRIRDKTRATLEMNAAANKRSLSEEAETLLDQALHSSQLLEQAFDLAVGPAAAGLVLLLLRAMQQAGAEAEIAATGHFVGDSWLEAPYPFDQVAGALDVIIETARPDGDASPPKATVGGRSLGRAVARRLLADVVAGRSQWHAGIRARLGPQTVERIKQNLTSGSQNV